MSDTDFAPVDEVYHCAQVEVGDPSEEDVGVRVGGGQTGLVPQHLFEGGGARRQDHFMGLPWKQLSLGIVAIVLSSFLKPTLRELKYLNRLSSGAVSTTKGDVKEISI